MAINSIPAGLLAGNPASNAAPQIAVQPARFADAFATSAATDANALATQGFRQAEQPTREQVAQAMSKVKEALPELAQNLQFSIDDDTGTTVVKVVDASTNELIRQIPSEEMLAISKAIDAFTGLLIKQKA